MLKFEGKFVVGDRIKVRGWNDRFVKDQPRYAVENQDIVSRRNIYGTIVKVDAKVGNRAEKEIIKGEFGYLILVDTDHLHTEEANKVGKKFFVPYEFIEKFEDAFTSSDRLSLT